MELSGHTGVATSPAKPGYTDLNLAQITPHIHAVHKLLST
jgi:hypothetical protein